MSSSEMYSGKLVDMLFLALLVHPDDCDRAIVLSLKGNYFTVEVNRDVAFLLNLTGIHDNHIN
jgi:hypothetical protein